VVSRYLQDHILAQKEIAGLVASCKGLATAYHSSINFSQSIHDAQVEVSTKPRTNA